MVPVEAMASGRPVIAFGKRWRDGDRQRQDYRRLFQRTECRGDLGCDQELADVSI